MPSLKRKVNPMSKDIRTALMDSKLMERYLSRPPYQRNDYLGWIARAVRSETKAKRLEQMLTELRQGGVYMRMKWNRENEVRGH